MGFSKLNAKTKIKINAVVVNLFGYQPAPTSRMDAEQHPVVIEYFYASGNPDYAKRIVWRKRATTEDRPSFNTDHCELWVDVKTTT
jgi:hypothetical protein